MNEKNNNIDSNQDTGVQREAVPEELAYRIVMAKVGIVGIVIGILITGYHLSFLQVLLAAVISSFGFVIPAWMAALGQKNGLASLTMSRATFGISGNRASKFFAWVNAFGWALIQVIISCWLFTAIITRGSIAANPWGLGTSGIITLALIALLIWRGESWNHYIRVWLHGLFVVLSLVVAAFGFSFINWEAIIQVASTDWLINWVPAVMLATVATSLISTMEAGNWGQSIKKGHYRNSTLVATLIGGGVPTYLLILVGILLGYGIPGLVNKHLPFMEIYRLLPGWLNNLYYVVAAIILCLHAMRAIQHAVNLAAPLGKQMKVSKAQLKLGHLIVLGLCTAVIITLPVGFFIELQLWLSTLGIIIFSWFGVFLADYFLNHRTGYDDSAITLATGENYHWEGIIAWGVAVLVGMLTTNNILWQGPWVYGIFNQVGSGVALAGIIGFTMIMVFKIIPLKQ